MKSIVVIVLMGLGVLMFLPGCSNVASVEQLDHRVFDLERKNRAMQTQVDDMGVQTTNLVGKIELLEDINRKNLEANRILMATLTGKMNDITVATSQVVEMLKTAANTINQQAQSNSAPQQ